MFIFVERVLSQGETKRAIPLLPPRTVDTSARQSCHTDRRAAAYDFPIYNRYCVVIAYICAYTCIHVCSTHVYICVCHVFTKYTSACEVSLTLTLSLGLRDGYISAIILSGIYTGCQGNLFPKKSSFSLPRELFKTL